MRMKFPSQQAFNWESHRHDWWRNLEKKVPDMASSGFTSIWLPPVTHSFSPQGWTRIMCWNLERDLCFNHSLNISIEGRHHIYIMFSCVTGYTPQNLYSLNSSYGSEHLLRALLQKMKEYKVRAMADIVINHRTGTTQGHGGFYNRYDGLPLAWDEKAVTCCSGGLVSILEYSS